MLADSEADLQALTCLSCSCHRRDGCTAFEAAWPDALLSDCPAACYEPGSDEREPTDINL